MLCVFCSAVCIVVSFNPSQDSVLFHDTIHYNIKYGKMDASDEEVLGASRMAEIHSVIENMPDKYETQVGERGLKLSGSIFVGVFYVL